MTRRMAILVAVVGLIVMAFAGTALAVVKVGNAGPNRLVGTAENDTLKGRSGGGHHHRQGRLGPSLRWARCRSHQSPRAWTRRRRSGRLRAGRDTVLTDNTTEDRILANCEVVRRG